jgi:hypothetical protein
MEPLDQMRRPYGRGGRIYRPTGVRIPHLGDSPHALDPLVIGWRR